MNLDLGFRKVVDFWGKGRKFSFSITVSLFFFLTRTVSFISLGLGSRKGFFFGRKGGSLVSQRRFLFFITYGFVYEFGSRITQSRLLWKKREEV